MASGWANRSQSERDRMKNVLENLKTERLSRGWTLQDVSDRTGISITVLKALESGNSDKLVAPSAVDALLQKYSTALKAQTEQIADRPQRTTGRDAAYSPTVSSISSADRPQKTTGRDAAYSPSISSADRPQRTTGRDRPTSRKTFRYIMKWLLLSAVFAAVFFGIFFWQTRETKDPSVKPREPAVNQTETTPYITSEQKASSGHEDLPPQHRELPEVEKQPPGSSRPDTALSSVPTPEQDAIPPAGPDEKSVVSTPPEGSDEKSVVSIPPAGPDEKSVVSIAPRASVRPAHALEITAYQRTWIQVVVDGRNTQTELLEAGANRKWRARDKVDLMVGNGAGVRLWWDGEPVEISRRRGSVVRLTLPKP